MTPLPSVILRLAAAALLVVASTGFTAKPAKVLSSAAPNPSLSGAGPERALSGVLEAIEESLHSLKEREAKILRLYFGIDGSEPMTLEEIGALLGITRERVRQIKEKALSRLRHVSRSKALESFLG